jgi:hypothetical protein
LQDICAIFVYMEKQKNKKTETISFRVEKEVKEEIKKLGGAKWLRKVLERNLKRTKN